jgi:hypothetical protein
MFAYRIVPAGTPPGTDTRLRQAGRKSAKQGTQPSKPVEKYAEFHSLVRFDPQYPLTRMTLISQSTRIR